MSRMLPSRHSAEAISAYRDALLRDASPETLQELAEGIDPELIGWLDLFRAAQREPVHLDPIFAARLDRAVAEAPGPGQALPETEPGKRLRVARSHAVSISRPSTTLLSSQRSQSQFAPRQVLSALATLAIVAVLLIAGLYTLGPLRPQAPIQMILAPDGPVHLEPIWKTVADEPMGSPYGVGVDPQGNIWVADEDRFHIVAPDGTIRETWGAAGSGDGEFTFLSRNTTIIRDYGDVAFDVDGNIYVADTGNSRIQKFAPDRTFLLAWGEKGEGDGQFLSPSSIAIGPDGVIYVGDDGRSNIQMFDTEGMYLGTIGEFGLGEGRFMMPSGVAASRTGDVYVADYGNRRIQQFTADGEFVRAWGKAGRGEGQFDSPNDVSIDAQGRVFVVEDINSRVQVFTPDGRILASIGTFGNDLGQLDDPLGLAIGPDGVVYVSDRNGLQAFRLVPGAAPATATP